MSDEISATQVRELIDEDHDLIGSVEKIDDPETEFNFLLDMYNKNHVLHVAKEDHLDFYSNRCSPADTSRPTVHIT